MRFAKALLALIFIAPCIASAADDARILEVGQEFICSPFPAASVLRGEPNNTKATCEVMGDVYSFFTKNLVMPAGSSLIGAVKDGTVQWLGWTTPNGVYVASVQNTPLTSFIPNADTGSLQVITTKDIKIQF